MLKFIDKNLLQYHLCNYKSNLKDAINIIENNHNRGLFLINEDKKVLKKYIGPLNENSLLEIKRMIK